MSQLRDSGVYRLSVAVSFRPLLNRTVLAITAWLANLCSVSDLNGGPPAIEGRMLTAFSRASVHGRNIKMEQNAEDRWQSIAFRPSRMRKQQKFQLQTSATEVYSCFDGWCFERWSMFWTVILSAECRPRHVWVDEMQRGQYNMHFCHSTKQ